MPLSGGYVTPTGPVNLIKTSGSEVILTAGSDLDQAAVSSGNRGLPWSRILNGATKFFNSFRPNQFKDVAVVKTPANFGGVTSQANYGFRGRYFDGVGSYPQALPRDPRRPEYNVLTPIVWQLRDLDPKQLAQMQDLIQVPVVQVAPNTFTPAGPASLQETLL